MTLLDRAIKEMLTGEMSVIAFEEELALIFAASADEVHMVMRAFYAKHAKDGKVSFAVLRRYLLSQDWHSYASALDLWLEEDVRDRFKEDIRKAINRGKATYLDELNMRVRHALEVSYMRERREYDSLLGLAILAGYFTRTYDMAQESPDGIVIVPISREDAQAISAERWQAADEYANWQRRMEERLDRLEAELEMVTKQAIASAQIDSAMIRLLDARFKTAMNRERSAGRTEMNRAMNSAILRAYKEAGIEQYEYSAILDEVTSDICRALDGQVFRVSQAQEGVNFPPMHVNCRSSTIAIFPKEAEDNAVRVSRTMTLEKFIEEYADEEDKDALLDYLSKYRQ